MLKQILIPTLFVLIFAVNLFAQNKFEGYNIILDVPETQTAMACAIRYAPQAVNVTISDLNPATPMSVKSCTGSGTTLSRSGATAQMRTNPVDNKWCFEGEDKKYRISFTGDQFSGNITYDWVTVPDEKNAGFYNIKDFGAVGDGRTDDTMAIKSAFAFVATRNGGQINFPHGEYMVSDSLVLPSGITIQGVNSLQTNATTNNIIRNNTSRITLTAPNKELFKIGECTEIVTIKDIELFARTPQNTVGVEAVGAYISSQGFNFERVTFQNFWRGIYAHGLNQTAQLWQFDYVKLKQCRFIYNTNAGIWVDVKNSDWKIEGCLFINPKRTPSQRADSMHFEHCGMILIEDTFGGGFAGALGGTFIGILDTGNTTVINSQTESMTESFHYNEAKNPYAGDYSYPLTFINCIFGDPIVFEARRTFVSIGSLYGPKTWRADERVRVYSTGDRFCYDGYILACQTETSTNNFDKATIMFMTGQPDEPKVNGRPAVFGTDVQFNGVAQMPAFALAALPQNKPNGSMVYCSNCKRSTTPCQGGGTGAPAMVVNNQWSCL